MHTADIRTARTPATGIVAVVLTALIGVAVIAKPGAAPAPAFAAPAAAQAVYGNDPGYPLADPVDWSRVAASPVTPGATVGAYDR